ncbi:hypothetical protein D9613_005042 [Agrocybe pediades]|uniref:Protein kinase domain-containing protein n=1 Tax=Agrocybe pediades TaxID=84607 RepID=A0A8H4QYN9_9AGAR|nr:hypothetical protein D9613_005042 [Agrocybe pediades]
MRQGKNKRSRASNSKDVDGETYMNVANDTIHSDSYSRSHSTYHVPETYRAPPPIPSRMNYPPERDVQPRSRRTDTDWRHPDMETERYPYVDPYARDDRPGYDDHIPRSAGGWRDVDHSSYAESRVDWSRRYDNGASTSSFSETSTWGIVNPSSYEHSRSMYPERWEPGDSRNQPLDDWGADMGRVDRRSDRRHHDWRPDGQRDKPSGHKFQSDSGWDTIRRERSTWGNEHVARHEPAPMSNSHHALEERAWEPAPSWKSAANGDGQPRGQNGQRNQQKQKRGQYSNKQRREWRADDGDPNNWTKRDTSKGTINRPPSNQYPSRRKHPRSPSPSRSRSRSPTGSYKSLRSSRGRSRSRSFSPASKRRRRDSSRATVHSQTPSDRSFVRQPRLERYSSRSPSPNRSPGSLGGRRRSPSVISTTGSERSRSRSPLGNGRSVHRLPANSALPDVIPNTSTRPLINGSSARKFEESKNGKGKKRDRTQRQFQQQQQQQHVMGTNLDTPKPAVRPTSVVPPPQPEYSTPTSMPPPSTIPASHIRPRQVAQESNAAPNARLPDKIDIAAKPVRTVVRNAGFKPIGKANSSLKKFFPGDDEENEIAVDESRAATEVRNVHTPAPDPSSSSSNTQPSMHEDLPTTEMASLASGYPISHQDLHIRSLQPTNRPSNPLPLPFPISSDSTATFLPPIAQHSLPVHGQESSNFAPPRTLHVQEAEVPKETRDPGTMKTVGRKDLYKIMTQVGEGTFGKVYKAQNTMTGTYVALKRIRMETERDGFPVTAMREIKLLQSLRHSNVVRLYEMMVSNGSVYMVFEYMDHDLTGVLSQTQFNFLDEHLKSLCHQMLAGLAYLHHKGVIHRDIKGSNILINNRGELKLADFGLARFYQKRRRADYTNRVITLWYRPPELLFGATVYGPEVDMWSAGCIMLELFTKKPIFQGADEIHQLEVIFKILGTPTAEHWPDLVNLPWYELVKPQHAITSRFREAFQKWMSPAALDLAEQLLAYDPARRITAMQAMNAPYFTEELPPASAPIGLVDLEGEWHELETKRERAKRKERKTVT